MDALKSHWVYSPEHGQVCRVLETQELWGTKVCQVWLSLDNRIVREPAARLRSVDTGARVCRDAIVWAATAARIADTLGRGSVLSPIGSSLLPLPHQFAALERIIGSERIRFLVADEVGLGKTIEAGLVLRELKLRGLVRRVLVIVPKGLVNQWISEMQTHFGETLRLVLPEDIEAFHRIAPGQSVWRSTDQIVCPVDSVKPIGRRKGWSKAKVEAVNRERYEEMIAAGWDLIIVDEAHRLGGSTGQVARHKLGRGLAGASPYLLLLSATPHQGETAAFRRLMSLLDEEGFPDDGSVTRERVAPYVVRTSKRSAVDLDGKALFQPRATVLAGISWATAHSLQQTLYEAVSSYVRAGYNRAKAERKSYLGFLLILMQRLVTSSTRAIRVALERRLEVLSQDTEQLSLFPALLPEEWAEMDGQEQAEMLLSLGLHALEDEQREVEVLLAAARAAESARADAKAEALIEWLYRLQREEEDPGLKVLIFTEFVPTQEMLRDWLTAHGFSVVCLNGSMDLSAREDAQAAFAGEARVMVSTEAGGEGLNLQFCHVVINYDLPWNPMRLEQRIGRVDRIGQAHPVKAVNFLFRDTVEFRVREILEEKLAVILQEFGVDKAGDVLDSGAAAPVFEDAYMGVLTDPERESEAIEDAVRRLYQQAGTSSDRLSVLPESNPVDASRWHEMLSHPLPAWVERMTVAHLRTHGGSAELEGSTWCIRWPDGHVVPSAVFSARDAVQNPGAVHLSLSEARIGEIVRRLPQHIPGQPIPRVELPGIAPDVSGVWSLWSVALHAGGQTKRRIMPLFVHDDGRVLSQTARFVWDCLPELSEEPNGVLQGGQADVAQDISRAAAQEHGRAEYEELLREHRTQIERQREAGEWSHEARKRALQSIGLPEVRAHRLSSLEREHASWRAAMEKVTEASPELSLISMARVEARTR